MNVVYIDLSKAFDRVSTNRLPLKLEDLGIARPLSKWFKDPICHSCLIFKCYYIRSFMLQMEVRWPADLKLIHS